MNKQAVGRVNTFTLAKAEAVAKTQLKRIFFQEQDNLHGGKKDKNVCERQKR